MFCMSTRKSSHERRQKPTQSTFIGVHQSVFHIFTLSLSTDGQQTTIITGNMKVKRKVVKNILTDGQSSKNSLITKRWWNHNLLSFPLFSLIFTSMYTRVSFQQVNVFRFQTFTQNKTTVHCAPLVTQRQRSVRYNDILKKRISWKKEEATSPHQNDH